MNETNNPIPTMPTPPGTYSAAAAEKLRLALTASINPRRRGVRFPDDDS